MRVHLSQRAEFAIQVSRYHAAKESIVPREAHLDVLDAALLKRAREQLNLRAFAGAVDSFERDEFTAGCHRGAAQSNTFDN